MSFTSSLNYTQTITQDVSGSLILQGSGSSGRTDLFTVNGNNGTLFSVSDDLSDSLFSVNTIAGLPVIEAFANNTVTLGQYGQNVLVVTGSRVGIGTSNPTSKLQVDGSIISNGGNIYAYAGSGEPNISVSLAGNQFYMFNNSTYYGLYSTDYGSILMRTKSSGLLNIYDKAYIDSSGNVGIGVTNPNSPLEINGRVSIRNANELYFGQSTSNVGSWTTRMYADGSTHYFNANQFIFNNSGYGYDEFIRIKSDGNVGIGTTNPGTKLQVNGSGASNVPVFKIVGSGSDTFNWASSSVFANLTGNENVIHLFGKAESGYNSAYVGYRHVSDGSSSNMLTFGLYGSDNLVNILGNGYVGIGTTAPSYALQVQGTAYINSTLYVNGATTIEDTFTVKTQDGSYTVAAIDYSGGAGGRIKVYTDGVLRTQIGSYYGDDTFFNVGYGGNVGIGLTNPSARLDVRSYASSGATNAPTFRAFAYDTDSFFEVNNNGNNSANITLYRSDSATMFSIDGHSGTTYFAGDVGIGTTNPAVTLDVNGSVNVKGSITGQDSSNNYRYEFSPNLAFTRVGVGDTGDYKINSGAASLTSMLRLKSSSTYGWLEGSQRFFNGTVISDGLSADTIPTAGTLVFLTSDAEWGIADADVAGKSISLLGIALNSTSGIGETVHVMIDGIISLYSNHDQLTDPATPGAPLYVSTNAGNVTEVAPSGTGDVVRLVGHNISSISSGNDIAVIRFQPDASWIEL